MDSSSHSNSYPFMVPVTEAEQQVSLAQLEFAQISVHWLGLAPTKVKIARRLSFRREVIVSLVLVFLVSPESVPHVL